MGANPWLERRVLHFAHQGGELEAPSNTLYAFKTAIAKGATAIETDLRLTRDGEVVVCHDATVDRTTDGSGAYGDLTLEQIQTLDAAYWFVPDLDSPHDRPQADYVMRGIAAGRTDPPAGFTAEDFRLPTLREILEDLRGVVLNVDLKDAGMEERVAALLEQTGRTTDVIVASFSDDTIQRFRAISPGVATAAGAGETQAIWAYAAEDAPTIVPYVALQAPWEFGGREVVNEDRMRRAQDAGVAVHIWTVNDEDVMRRLVGHGVHGVMTARPTLLQRVLDDLGVAPG